MSGQFSYKDTPTTLQYSRKLFYFDIFLTDLISNIFSVQQMAISPSFDFRLKTQSVGSTVFLKIRTLLRSKLHDSYIVRIFFLTVSRMFLYTLKIGFREKQQLQKTGVSTLKIFIILYNPHILNYHNNRPLFVDCLKCQLNHYFYLNFFSR